MVEITEDKLLEVKLIDFGFACEIDPDNKMTLSLGSVAYSSP